jgi:hypothetical protein
MAQPEPKAPALRLVGQPRPPEPPQDERPEVQVSYDLARNVDALDEALGRSAEEVFQRALELVEVVTEKRPSLVSEGTPVLRKLNLHSVGVHVMRGVDTLVWKAPTKKDPGGWVLGRPPADTALLPLLAFGRWRHIRPISGITEAPLFRPDGTIMQEAGYDPPTGYLFRPNALFPLVPSEPTQEDAKRALLSLQHVFCDFPYTSPAAAAVPIAALLTILARAAIDGPVPVFGFEASVQGSGKTMQGDIVHLIATGRLPPKSSFPETATDQRKELLSLALSGSPVGFFDNVKGVFGGAALEGLVTSGELRQRVLGASEDKVVRWLATIIVTGNNMHPTEDMIRRMLMCRIEPDTEDPTKRTQFAHDDLIGWVKAERERLIVAALTILRAYACKGYPDAGAGIMQSFHGWSKLVPGAIIYAGGPNVIETVGTAEAGSDEAAAVSSMIRLLPIVCGKHPQTAREILTAMYAGSGEHADQLKEAIELLAPPKGSGETKPSALGLALRNRKGQVSGTQRIVLIRDKHRKIDLWQVVSTKPEQQKLADAPVES